MVSNKKVSPSPQEDVGTILPRANKHERLQSQSPPSNGFSTPPMWMPDAPLVVVDRDMVYTASEKQMESKDWAMWHRLSANGMKVDSPDCSLVDPISSNIEVPEDSDEALAFDFEF